MYLGNPCDYCGEGPEECCRCSNYDFWKPTDIRKAAAKLLRELRNLENARERAAITEPTEAMRLITEGQRGAYRNCAYFLRAFCRENL